MASTPHKPSAPCVFHTDSYRKQAVVLGRADTAAAAAVQIHQWSSCDGVGLVFRCRDHRDVFLHCRDPGRLDIRVLILPICWLPIPIASCAKGCFRFVVFFEGVHAGCQRRDGRIDRRDACLKRRRPGRRNVDVDVGNIDRSAAGGHFSAYIMRKKVMDSSQWWPVVGGGP